MSNPKPKRFNLRSIPCPTCGADIGEDCSAKCPDDLKLKYSFGHKARWAAWDREHKNIRSNITMVTFFNHKPNKRAVRKLKNQNNLKFRSKVRLSANCTKGLHNNCFVLNCTCNCHDQFRVK